MGINSKKASIVNVFSELSPDIGLVCETHLTSNTGVDIEGFSYFGKARLENKGGGVGIFVKNTRKPMVAPHQSSREIEIAWVSINRGKSRPLYIGVYYGKQESVSLEKIKEEFDELADELAEINNLREVILCMDANAKIGLMGEDISRNGDLMIKALDASEMIVINGTEQCSGKITRQNRSR